MTTDATHTHTRVSEVADSLASLRAQVLPDVEVWDFGYDQATYYMFYVP